MTCSISRVQPMSGSKAFSKKPSLRFHVKYKRANASACVHVSISRTLWASMWNNIQVAGRHTKPLRSGKEMPPLVLIESWHFVSLPTPHFNSFCLFPVERATRSALVQSRQMDSAACFAWSSFSLYRVRFCLHTATWGGRARTVYLYMRIYI